MQHKKRRVSDIPGLEDFFEYYVTTEGKIYSMKGKMPREIKQVYLTRKGSYRIVKLSNRGKVRNFYVHRLVAQLFILNPNQSWGVEHINGDLDDNHVSNLRWIGKRISKDSDELDTERIFLGKEISDYIKQVHEASLIKGINVPAEIDFFHGMINQALEEYINRYGLRKIMYGLKNEST